MPLASRRTAFIPSWPARAGLRPRLCRFFGLSEGYFLRLQNIFDMLEAKRRSAREIAKIKPFKAVAA
jgi:plasmid maintenance system antidote protein VapI